MTNKIKKIEFMCINKTVHIHKTCITCNHCKCCPLKSTQHISPKSTNISISIGLQHISSFPSITNPPAHVSTPSSLIHVFLLIIFPPVLHSHVFSILILTLSIKSYRHPQVTQVLIHPTHHKFFMSWFWIASFLLLSDCSVRISPLEMCLYLQDLRFSRWCY